MKNLASFLARTMICVFIAAAGFAMGAQFGIAMSLLLGLGALCAWLYLVPDREPS